MQSEARQFLEALFAGKPDELYLLIRSEKESRCFRSVDDAICYVDTLHDHDLHVGVGLFRQDLGPNGSCLPEEVAGIVAACADLNLRSDAHPKPTLPRTIEQALSILPPEMPPSFVISTGNGLQVCWLFRDPYVFDNDAQRRQATVLVNRWSTLLRDNASQRGWTHERIADLDRVRRIPATTNCKGPSDLKPVVARGQNGCRYLPSDLTKYLDQLAVPDLKAEARVIKEWAERLKGTPLIINLSAQIPDDRLNRWLADDLRFKNTWFRQRHDLHDQSQESYDLALARYGFDVGCTEQEVVDLIVHHRSLHKQKQRTRLSYFERTLSKVASRPTDGGHGLSPGGAPTADASPAKPAAPGDATTPLEEDKRSATGTAPERAKIDLCRQISGAFGVEVLRLVKLTGKDPLYRLELAEGKIEFASVGKLIKQGIVRDAIAATAGVFIPRIKSKEWDGLAQMMLSACIEEEGSEELQYEGAARMYIGQYLAEATFISSIEGQIAQNLRKPMLRDGRITVCASDLQIYINKTTLQSLTVRAVAAMLSAIGARAIRVRGKKIREQGRWELPLEECDPNDYPNSSAEEPPDETH